MSETKLTEEHVHVVARPRLDTERVTLLVYDDATAATRVVELPDGGEVTFGRSRSANVQIDSEQVSRIHATFARRGAELTVADAGSRNGTWVNGERIAAPHRLTTGDEVHVGSVTVVVSITAGVAGRARLEGTRYLEERLAAEVDRGRQFQRTCALVLVQLEGPPELADEATERLVAALRPMEALAEWAPGVLAIIMPELDAAAAERAARGLVATACARDELRAYIGIAAFPEHSTTVGGLIARAHAALEAVRRSGAGAGVPPADAGPPAGEAIVVHDPAMAKVYELVRKVADHPITVLVRGETGVGKEVVASAIHAASSRRDGPLIRINCASLPESLLESELFGHEKGAFTGATQRKLGFFEAAHGGTLFLDEIGEMTGALQAKLLRVLETRRIVRVGGTQEVEVDVRMVCATHRDLEAESRAGTFRSDLFFRIGAFTILVPPLRNRPSEIEPLATAFIEQVATDQRRRAPALSPAAALALRRYSWPGNVRELRNTVERALVLCSGAQIGIEDLPDSIRDARTTAEVTATTFQLDGQRDVRDHIADLERVAIAAALDASGGNQTEAAKQLGISRRTLIYRMEKHGLKPPPPGAKR